MTHREELAWAAGLFEGEGCFSLINEGRYPHAGLSMTDEDSVRRFAAALGIGTVKGPYLKRTKSIQPYWVWTVSRFETTQAAVALLWYGLGARRRARAREVIANAKVTRPQTWTCIRGHELTPENIILVDGRGRKCRTCRNTAHRAWTQRKKAEREAAGVIGYGRPHR